ncbi:glucose-6-phosphate isomerase [Chitinasiproducens palmae]|nr:glucose-6-phosphate isomerase [Chitinasiproducens palmae]
MPVRAPLGTDALLRDALREARRDAAPRAASTSRHGGLLLPLLFFAVTALLIVAGQGRALEVGYPLLAVVVGIALYRRHPVHYVGFVCWLLFLSPEVRRFADYYNGAFNPTSPIQVAPLAVALLSAWSLLRHHRVLGSRAGLPFLLVLVGVFYAYPIGAIRNSPLAATYSLALWAFPALIGFHVLTTWHNCADYERVLARSFGWGLLVMGGYGMIQFALLPPWDAFWLRGTKLVTEGLPLPFQIRVSSTMNSSAPLAETLMAGLLLLVARPGRTGWLAGVLAFLSLLLSAVRAAWGGWLVGMLFLTISLSARMRWRVLAAALVLSAVAIPLASTDEASAIIASRFQTIGELGSDTSFNERANFYGAFLATAFSEIGGAGLGVAGDTTRLNDQTGAAQMASFDSGLMEIPYTLGWSGALLYFVGSGTLLLRAIAAARRRKHDRFAGAWAAVAVSLASILVFTNTLVAGVGMLFFLGTVMPLIAARTAPR